MGIIPQTGYYIISNLGDWSLDLLIALNAPPPPLPFTYIYTYLDECHLNYK